MVARFVAPNAKSSRLKDVTFRDWHSPVDFAILQFKIVIGESPHMAISCQALPSDNGQSQHQDSEGEMQFNRYAIYYTPAPGPLADFGARWLGCDISSGQETPRLTLPGLTAKEVAEVTQIPRRYGFHATITPPFRLAQGTDTSRLTLAFQRAVQERSPVTLPGLKLARIGGFLALVVDGDQTPVAQLAEHMVATLDQFRAPATDQDLARRRKVGLTPRQEEMLLKWGYPYLFDDFTFHLTLTGKLPPDQTDQICSALEPILTPLLPRPFAIGDLTLVGEDAVGNFHEISRVALGASGKVWPPRANKMA